MEESKEKFFSEKQIDISAVIAGPIPPGILIYKNYKELGENRKANFTLVLTLLFTICLFYGMMQIPDETLDKIPNFAFSLLYGLMVFLFFRKFMAKDVNKAFETGATKRSNWSVAGLTIIGLLLNLAIIFAIASEQPYYSGTMLEVSGNELFYDDSIPLEDVNRLANHLESKDFFGENYRNLARLQVINDEYFITLYVDKQLWEDQNTISFVTNIKWLMEIEFGRKTHLKLESASLAGSEYKFITD